MDPFSRPQPTPTLPNPQNTMKTRIVTCSHNPIKGWSAFVYIVLAMCLTASTASAAEVDILKVTTLDPTGLTFATGSQTKFSTNINGRTFGKQNAVTTFNGWQYSTYYDENRNVVLGRRQLPDGDWQLIRFTDYQITSSDAHNLTSVGICEGGGTLPLAFYPPP